MQKATHHATKTLNQVPVNAKYMLEGKLFRDAIRIGRERNSKNQKARVRNRNYSGRNDDSISIQGVIGEMAFLKLFGFPVEPVYDTTLRGTKNDTFDAKMPNGMTVDIKTTVWSHVPIMTPIWKKHNKPGCLALMIIERPRGQEKSPFTEQDEFCIVRFCGFVSGTKMFHKQNLVEKWNKWYYSYAQENLKTYDAMIMDNDFY